MGIPRGALLLLFASNLLSVHAANWMYLGVVGVTPHLPQSDQNVNVAANDSSLLSPVSGVCGHLPGLVDQQVAVCRSHPDALNSVSDGARLGIQECQYQFRNERWNCSTVGAEAAVPFGRIIEKGSRETAFIYAVTSAGVVHAVTKACSSGNLTDCSCDMSKRGLTTPEGWKWGGCSDNLKFGLHFAKQFVDAPERERQKKKKSFRNLMNLHNNEAGREAVEREMRMQCRCHGVSGSCELKTCWRSLASFSRVGEHLKRKYDSSVQVMHRRRRRKAKSKGGDPKAGKKRRRRRSRWVKRIPVAKDDLVHIHRSPNYCVTNAKRGVLGTQGRACSNTSHGPDSCQVLCCGRGFITKTVRYVERCHCKFMWCCYVKCKTCITNVDVHICK